MRAPFNGWFAGGQRPVVMKESHEKCPSCKGKVWFLCSSPKLISQLTGAPSRDDVLSCGLQYPKSSKASGKTNSEEDICIPANYVKSCDSWLEPVNTNKNVSVVRDSNDAWKRRGGSQVTARDERERVEDTVHVCSIVHNVVSRDVTSEIHTLKSQSFLCDMSSHALSERCHSLSAGAGLPGRCRSSWRRTGNAGCSGRSGGILLWKRRKVLEDSELEAHTCACETPALQFRLLNLLRTGAASNMLVLLMTYPRRSFHSWAHLRLLPPLPRLNEATVFCRIRHPFLWRKLSTHHSGEFFPIPIFLSKSSEDG